MSDSSVLLQLGQSAIPHRDTLEEVKRRVGVAHNYFDCWIYGFLENKNFDVEETVAKLIRRDQMERNELASYDITDYMRETMAKGIIQLIGDDKEGRVTFYIVTNRDHPTSKRREENKRNFDMWLSYGTRLRKENQKCRITMLINQTDASMWSNTDMTFQADVALRIAKYYPGAVDRMYICKMNRTLAALAKPIFARLPKVVSERIFIFTESDIEKGKLLQLFDEEVLPVALGGKNACDGPANWNRFGETITRHFTHLKAAVQGGQGVKDWELDQLKKELGCEDSVSQAGSEGEAERSVVPSRGVYVAAAHTGKPQQVTSVAPFHQPRISRTDTLGGAADHNLLPSPVDEEGSHQRTSALKGERTLAYVDDDLSSQHTLLTCHTDDNELLQPGGDGDVVNAYSPYHEDSVEMRTVATGKRSIDATIVEWNRDVTQSRSSTADAVAMLELYEVTFRTNLVELEAMDILTIVERFAPPSELGDGPSSSLFGAGNIIAFLPPLPRPLRSVVRGTLFVICVTVSFYFIVATIFAASLGCSMMTAFFYAMFDKPHHFYPYSFALVVSGYQTCTICSRGYELVRTSFRGRVLHCLRRLGPLRGLQVQAVLFFGITLALFVVFCVYASNRDPVAGIQFSIASGWVICSVLLLAYHVLFIGGIRRSCDDDKGYNKNISAVSLYLLLDVTEPYDDADKETRLLQRWSLVYGSIPVGIATMAGIAFMISVNQVFLIGMLAGTAASGFYANFMTHGDSWDHSATLVRLAVSFCSVAWYSVVVSIGFFGTSNGWGASMAILLVTAVVWMCCALGSAKFSKDAARRQWLFRAGCLILAAHAVTSTVMLFDDSWRMGLLVVGLFVHSVVSFYRPSATSKIGTLTCMVGFLGLVIATVVIGLDADGTSLYSERLSGNLIPNRSYFANTTSTVMSTISYNSKAKIPDYVACLLRFTPRLDIAAMSLLATLGYSSDVTALRTDLASFFPGMVRVTDNSAAADLQKAVVGSCAHVEVYYDATENATVITFTNAARNSYLVMEAMTMWVEAMAIGPLTLILPQEWTIPVVKAMSEISTAIAPLRWSKALDAVQSALASYVASADSQVFVVGHDIAGGFATVAAAHVGVPCVTFGTPGTVYSTDRFGLPNDADLQVQASVFRDSTLSLIGGLSERAVGLSCSTTSSKCRHALAFTNAILASCSDDRW